MKTIQLQLYEPGDHVLVTSGYNKGKVGTVISHPKATANVVYALAGVEYDTEDEDDDWYDEDYNEDYFGEYEDSQVRYLKHITKTEYETTLKKLKILTVPGLPVSIRIHGTNLIIGGNVVTAANAKKIAEFITENTKPTAAKTKKKKK